MCVCLGLSVVVCMLVCVCVCGHNRLCVCVEVNDIDAKTSLKTSIECHKSVHSSDFALFGGCYGNFVGPNLKIPKLSP